VKIGLQAWGSEGDVRPVVALAVGLRRAGHEVRLDLTPVDGTDYAKVCAAAGVALRLIPEKLEVALHTYADSARRLDPLKVSRDLVARAFNPYLDAFYEAALQLCEWSDVVVWHYSCWYTLAAALKTGRPHAAVHLFPGLAPTRYAPPPGMPDLGRLNRMLWSLARPALDLQFRKRPAQFFAARGLPPIRHVLPDLMFSTYMNLHAASPVLLPRPPDWDAHHHVPGQFTLPSDAEPWRPAAGLQAFLDDGPPPALLSLGSMEHLAPQRARDLLIGAARHAGVRAIVQTKRSGEEGRDGALYFLPWAPHEALLPRCSMAVHHGGAGTTHAVLRAGIPAVIVPFIFEQQAWGDRLRVAGAAPKLVGFWKATATGLGERIKEVAASEPLRLRARVLGAEISREEGVQRAMALLESLGL
jgi:UDP:flavonoid glycosyltransferase YjiC (YdhE family)